MKPVLTTSHLYWVVRVFHEALGFEKAVRFQLQVWCSYLHPEFCMFFFWLVRKRMFGGFLQIVCLFVPLPPPIRLWFLILWMYTEVCGQCRFLMEGHRTDTVLCLKIWKVSLLEWLYPLQVGKCYLKVYEGVVGNVLSHCN